MSTIPAARLVAEIGVDGEVSSASKLAAFGGVVDKAAARQVGGAQRIGGAFQKLDGQLGSFGVPFTGALGVVGGKLEETSTKGQSALRGLSTAGTVAGLGIAAIGVESLRAADTFDVAHGRLVTAAQNVGQSFTAEAGTIKAADDKLVNLGFTSTQTESALATLTTATKDVGTASGLMGLAADIARGRNTDLATATGILVKVETGHVGLLGKLGINTKDATGKTISQEEAIRRLTALYGGQASKYLDTYAGKTSLAAAMADELGVKLGHTEKDAVAGVTSAVLTGVSAFQSFNSALDGVPGKALAVGAGLAGVAVVGAKVITTTQGVAAAFGGTSVATSASAVALEAETAAALQADAANAALGVALTSASASAAEVTAASEAAAAAQEQLATASASAASASGAEGASMLAMMGPLALVVGGIVGGGIALNHFFGGDNHASQIQQLATGLTSIGKGAQDAQAGLAKIVGGGASSALAHYSDLLLANGSADDLAAAKAQALGQAVLANGGNFVKANDQVDRATGSLRDLIKQQGAGGVQTAALSAAQKTYRDDLATVGTSEQTLAKDKATVIATSKAQATTQDAVTAATNEGAAAASASATAAQRQAAAETALSTALKHLNDDTLASANADIAAKQANIDVGNAAAALIDKVKALGAAGGDTAQKTRDVASAQLDLQGKLLSGVSSAEAAAKAHVDLTSKSQGTALAVEEETAKHKAAKAELDVLKFTYPQLSGVVDDYATKLGLIPKSVDTRITVNGQTFSGGTISISGNVRAHAAGGTARPGEVFTSGEQGVELGRVRPDGGGVDFLSAPQTRHVLGGGGADLRPLLERVVALLEQPRGVQIGQIVSDPAGVVRELDRRDRVQRLLLSVSG